MEHHGISLPSHFLHVLISLASVAIGATIYYYVISCCRHLCRRGSPLQQPDIVSERGETRITVENPVIEPIPTHKHQKRAGLAGEDGMCSICLCEFEEGEKLRTLSECLHSYHTPCIDMWLYSHSSCPMCRSHTMPSSYILEHLHEFKSANAASFY